MKTTSIFAAGLLALALLAATANATTTIPGTSGSASSPDVTTIAIPSHAVHVDAISAPATCTQSICTQETTVGPVGVPSITIPCLPSESACVVKGTTDPIPLAPASSLPAICTVASSMCLPGMTLLPEQDHATPGVPATQVLPAGFLALEYGVADTIITDPTVVIGTIVNHEVHVLFVHLTLCQTPCPYPQVSSGGATSSVTLVATVGGTQVGGTFPLTA